jgi:Uncharacterized conserved protein (DUF2190)
MQGNIALLTLTVIAAGALAANRFITLAGAYPAAGANPLGVSRSSAAVAGDLVPTDVIGTATVEAAGNFTAGQALMVDNQGRVVVHDGDGDKFAIAKALEAGSNGAFVEVLLLPTAGPLVTAT